jgi:hypothetical protein
MLALNFTSTFCGSSPNNSVAFAAHNATAIGSVQPIAGTTSRFINAIIALRSFSGNIVVILII